MRSVLPFLFAVLLAGSAHAEQARVSVKPTCIISSDDILFMLDFRWNVSMEFEGKFKKYSARHITQVQCTKSTAECSGVVLNASTIDEGKPLGIFDLSEMVGASLVDKARARRQIRVGLDDWDDQGSKKMRDVVADTRAAFEADMSRLDTTNNRGFIVNHGFKVYLFYTVGPQKDWTVTMYEIGGTSVSRAHASCR